MPDGTLAVGAALWLTAGFAVASRLHRDGHPAAEVAAAVPCWPLFVPALAAPGAGAPRPASDPPGPFAARIDAAVAQLAAVLAEEAGGGELDVRPLHAALHRADARLARVDRLLLTEGAAPHPDDPTLHALHAARATAAEQVEAVLDELRRVRLQAGLRALDADAAPLSEQLADLSARARALDELTPTPPRPPRAARR